MGRKSRLTLADWSRIKSTSVENKSGYQTRKEFLEQEEQEQARIAASEERRKTAPLREAEQELREAAREASARIAMYWKIPIEEIQMNPVSITRVDIAGDYEIGPRDEPAENAAWKEFQENLKSFGCTLSDAGLLRLSHYLSSLNYHRRISLTSVSNFATALERLVSLGVFQSGELQNYQPTVVEQPVEPRHRHGESTLDEPTGLAELDSLSLESRAGNARAKQIVEGLVGDEEKAAWERFISQLHSDTGHLLTNQERLAIFNTCKRRGLDIRNPRRLREVVVALAKTGELPNVLLSEQDKLDIFIEASDLSDIAVRQEINRRQRIIHEQAERQRLER